MNLICLPGRLIVPGDAAATARNLPARVLYRLFRDVQRELVQAPLGWLVLNGFAYLVLSSSEQLSPQPLKLTSMVAFPALLGEAAFMLWLVVRGARPRPSR